MTVDEKGLQAAWNAYMRELREPWQDRVEAAITAYESARSAEPVAPEIGEEEIARAIVGPHRPVHASSQWALDELREVRWRQLTNREQAEALSQARAVLALLHPALERARGEAADQKERADRLQAHLDARPAMNAGLAEEYAKWSGKAYLMDSEGIYRPERVLAFVQPANDEPA